jgi:predicted nucleic-acid-binding protein
MIGLDTNVLIRYVMQDDRKQFARAERLVQSARKRKEPLFINLTVLCEVIWVLKFSYELPKEELSRFLGMLLHAELVEIEHREIALNAFHDYQNGQADFADCLIGQANKALGCSATYTFDKKAAKLSSFKLL